MWEVKQYSPSGTMVPIYRGEASGTLPCIEVHKDELFIYLLILIIRACQLLVEACHAARLSAVFVTIAALDISFGLWFT